MQCGHFFLFFITSHMKRRCSDAAGIILMTLFLALSQERR